MLQYFRFFLLLSYYSILDIIVEEKFEIISL